MFCAGGGGLLLLMQPASNGIKTANAQITFMEPPLLPACSSRVSFLHGAACVKSSQPKSRVSAQVKILNNGRAGRQEPPTSAGQIASGRASHSGPTRFRLVRHICRQLSVSITGLNITNQPLLTDNSLSFGGLHWNNSSRSTRRRDTGFMISPH